MRQMVEPFIFSVSLTCGAYYGKIFWAAFFKEYAFNAGRELFRMRIADKTAHGNRIAVSDQADGLFYTHDFA
jgi:hypothetical protein